MLMTVNCYISCCYENVLVVAFWCDHPPSIPIFFLGARSVARAATGSIMYHA